MLKIKRLATTVIRGARPLMVCTRETGMRDIASEVRIWPPIIKPVNGNVAIMMSRFGGLIPFLRAGMRCLSVGYTDDSQLRRRHQEVTSANWTIVRVTGLGKVLRISPAEVLATMEVIYQAEHKNLICN